MSKNKKKFTWYLSRNVGKIIKGARAYDNLVEGRKITYYFHRKGIPKRRVVYFYGSNFMHLCGVHRYHKKAKGFYKDAIDDHLKLSKIATKRPKYVDGKLNSLKHIPKLVKKEELGFSEGTVVHKGTSYGEMVRTQSDLFALGTVEDRVTSNLVPLSLINIKVATDGVTKAVGDWSKVSHIKIEDMTEQELNAHNKG